MTGTVNKSIRQDKDTNPTGIDAMNSTLFSVLKFAYSVVSTSMYDAYLNMTMPDRILANIMAIFVVIEFMRC
jgi:hypothetical protein